MMGLLRIALLWHKLRGSTRGVPETVDGRFEYSDIRILNLFRI